MDFGGDSESKKLLFSKGKKEKMGKEKMDKVVTDTLMQDDQVVGGGDGAATGSLEGVDLAALGLDMSNFSGVETKNAKIKKSKLLKHKDPAKTRAARAGLVFPVARIHSKLKAMVPAHCRVGGTAAVFMAAVIEYLVAEMCELAGNRAKKTTQRRTDDKKMIRRCRINPRFLQFAIQEDPEFATLLNQVTLSGGGVIPLSDKTLKEQTTAHKRKADQILESSAMQIHDEPEIAA